MTAPNNRPATSPNVVPETPRLAEPLTKVLAPKTAHALASLGLETVDDLLRHYPRRYVEPGEPTPVSELAVGQHVSIQARVVSAQLHPMRNRTGARLAVTVNDGERDLSLTFFAKRTSSLRYHLDQLTPERVGVFSGTVSEYRNKLQLTHPNYHLYTGDDEHDINVWTRMNQPAPIYPANAEIQTWQIERAISTVLGTLTEDDVPDPIPDAVRAEYQLPDRLTALRMIHRPRTNKHWKDARHRLRFEEAFVLQAALAQRRLRAREQPAVARPQTDRSDSLVNRFAAQLPFSLTSGQNQVAAELAVDISQPRPMLRLLQGEVGSGKTILALLAMLQVVDAGGQAALLAPTEVLAAQHARNLRELLGPLALGGQLGGDPDATRVALLTGSMSTAAKRQALADAASGAAGIVVGTHALLSEHVQFADLGLIVVDEQHRFGVEQRDTLRAKGQVTPHLLVMTATPIPRTVAMTAFGDLDISTLKELPVGRAGTKTFVVREDNSAWLARAWERVREEIDAGHRAYVVCPRIGDDGPANGEPEMTSVLEIAEKLRATPALRGVDIEVLHGQLPPAEKDAVMARFAAGRCQLLVATTVVEVGLDVPEATVMVVFDAERFGLSQLHQLRGRVGRGSSPGLCLLITGAAMGSLGERRVQAMTATSDGFELAERDLQLRREGDVLGAAQSGRSSSLRLLSVIEHEWLIKQTRGPAWEVVAADPELRHSPALAAAIAAQLDADQEAYLERI